MADPQTAQTEGYPQLQAAIGAVYGAMPVVPLSEFNGGPTYAASLSEPNTSPDVITIYGCIDPSLYKQTTQTPKPVPAEHTLPSGTPIAVDAYGHLNGEPRHKITLLNSATHDPFHENEVAACSTTAFVTVTVGDVTFRRNQCTFFAVAIQNCATVSMLGHIDSMKDVCIGDKLHMQCPASAGLQGVAQPFLKKTWSVKKGSRLGQAEHKQTSRVVTVVAPMIGGTVQCDLGEILGPTSASTNNANTQRLLPAPAPPRVATPPPTPPAIQPFLAPVPVAAVGGPFARGLL